MMPNSTQNINSVEFLSFEFYSLESREKDTQEPQCTYTCSFSVLVCTYHALYQSVPTIFVSIEALQFDSSYASIRRDTVCFQVGLLSTVFLLLLHFCHIPLDKFSQSIQRQPLAFTPGLLQHLQRQYLYQNVSYICNKKRDFGPLGWHGGAVAGLRWSDVK